MRVFERPPNAIATVIVLYDHPRDYPHHFVLRAQCTLPDQTTYVTNYAYLFPAEAKAREFMQEEYPDFFPVPPLPGDASHIIGTWI